MDRIAADRPPGGRALGHGLVDRPWLVRVANDVELADGAHEPLVELVLRAPLDASHDRVRGHCPLINGANPQGAGVWRERSRMVDENPIGLDPLEAALRHQRYGLLERLDEPWSNDAANDVGCELPEPVREQVRLARAEERDVLALLSEVEGGFAPDRVPAGNHDALTDLSPTSKHGEGVGHVWEIPARNMARNPGPPARGEHNRISPVLADIISRRELAGEDVNSIVLALSHELVEELTPGCLARESALPQPDRAR